MKNIIHSISCDFKRYVEPKRNFFLTVCYSLAALWGIGGLMLYFSEVGVIAWILVLFVLLVGGLGLIWEAYRGFKSEGLAREKDVIMEVYLEEIVLKDDKTSQIYNDTSEQDKSLLLRILFDNELMRIHKENFPKH